MLFIDNIPILTTVEEVINDLKIEFANSNIRIFEKVNRVYFGSFSVIFK